MNRAMRPNDPTSNAAATTQPVDTSIPTDVQSTLTAPEADVSQDKPKQDQPRSGRSKGALRIPGSTPRWVEPTPSSALDAMQVPRPWWQRLDVANLDDWDCEPLHPIIDGILARGNLCSLVAETQTGKTLLSLYLARRLLAGGKLFGRFQITPVKRVMYLMLEDPVRRLQERLLDTDHEFPERPSPGALIFHAAPGFSLADDRMWQWLEGCIGAGRPDVVFIDTYQKATSGITSFDDKEQSPLLHKLADLTRRLGITIIVIDHVRKRPVGKGRRAITIDDLKGTGGKAQNCDVVILMERTKNREGIVFQSFSKDFDVPVRIELRVAPRGSREAMKFTYVEDVKAEPGRGGRGRARVLTDEAVLSAFTEWCSTTPAAKTCGVSTATMRRELKRLEGDGKVVHNGKKSRNSRYRRADADTTGIGEDSTSLGNDHESDMSG